MAIETGACATLTFTVDPHDTAAALGSGDVDVLGTPRLIAWCEAATVAAVESGLADGETSVGFKIAVDHLAPTPVGATVEVTAEVEAVDGRQVRLAVEATDPSGTVGSGTVTRVVVDRASFMGRLG